MILHLGVTEFPYANEHQAGKRDKVANGTQTTGDVATWLEERYHVMEIFFHEHDADVAAALEEGLAGSLESLLMGAPATLDAFGEAKGKIETLFKTFLLSGEIEHLGIPGVPTKAALDRRSGRSASGKANKTSFIDTGLYETSFIDWVD